MGSAPWGITPEPENLLVEEWYANWFGPDYIRLYPHRDTAEANQQVDFLLRTLSGLKGDIRVLDLCCGAGRHTRLLAGRGFRVVGVDLSASLLAQAAGTGYQLARCDMRRLPFGPVFGLVTNFFTSFGYFSTDAENRQILEAIASVMTPGGQFLIDYLNPDQVRAGLVPESRTTLPDGSRVQQKRWVNEETGRVEKDILISSPDGGERTYRESVRLYTQDEMAEMIAGSGLTLEGVYGDFRVGASFGSTSPRMILTGRRNSI
jgi:SAM-dependent methyltransferase